MSEDAPIVDILWEPIRDKKISKKDFASCAARLNELLASAGDRRALVLAHVPRHLFEDVSGKVDPDVAFDMIVRVGKTHGWEDVEQAVRGTLSVDALSPFQAETREDAREAARAAARSALEEGKNEEPQVDRKLFPTPLGVTALPSQVPLAVSTAQAPPINQITAYPSQSAFSAPQNAPNVTFAASTAPTAPITQETARQSEIAFSAPQNALNVTFAPPTLATMQQHNAQQQHNAKDERPKKHHRKSSDTSSDSSVDTEAGFEHPKVLLDPKRWPDILARDPRGSTEFLRQLRSQMMVDRLCVTQPGRWTTSVAEELCLALTAVVDANDHEVATRLLHVLWRFRGFAEGATPQAIEESVKTLRSHNLPREYRDATKKLKTGAKNTSQQSTTSTQAHKGSFRRDQTSKSKPATTAKQE